MEALLQMDNSEQPKEARLTQDETNQLISQIPVLKKLLESSKPDRVRLKIGREIESISNSRFSSETLFRTRKSCDKRDLEEDSVESMLFDFKDTNAKDIGLLTPSMLRERRRLAVSLATLASRPNRRLDAVREGAVPFLASLCAIPDLQIRKSCASAFASLSKESLCRSIMIDQGAFAILGTLAIFSNGYVVANACRAICNLLCWEEGNESKALRDGALAAALYGLNIYPSALEVYLKILLNLSCVSENFARLEEVADALINFSSLSMSLDDEVLLVSIVCNISAIRSLQLRLIEAGALKFVDRAMKSPNLTLRCLGSNIVNNLATESRTRAKLMDAGMISTLLVMASDADENVRVSCMKTFYNFARDVSCRERIVNANAVAAIIKMSKESFTNALLGRTASRILRILCADVRAVHKLVQDGIVQALISLLRTDDRVIHQCCAESICSLFQMNDVIKRLADQGAIAVLVSIAQSNHDTTTGEWCAFALYHLATNEICTQKMIENSIIPSIVTLCQGESSVRTKEMCSAALEYVSRNPDVDTTMSIPLLVKLLSVSTDLLSHETKTYCAAALYNVANKDEYCALMLNEGALIPVVQLSQSELTHLTAKMKCVAILSRLSVHERYHEEFVSGDVMRVLMKLSLVDHIFTQRKVIIALSNLTRSVNLRDQLLSLNPMPYIISLASRCDENLRRACACIICNLSSDVGAEMKVAQTGVVQTLMIIARITSDQVATKIICVKAIVNLLPNRQLLRTMADEGVVWAIGTLASQFEDQELLQLSVVALCHLSSEYARYLLDQMAVVGVILRAINESSNIEMMRMGARTLKNMLIATTNKDSHFRALAVDNLGRLAESNDEEIMDLCILCLYLASHSMSTGKAIIHSLRKIGNSGRMAYTNDVVSISYLSLYRNVALNSPEMRSELLDDKSITKFLLMAESSDPSLLAAVVSAVYSISCEPDNIGELVNQNFILLFDKVIERSPQEPNEIFNTSCAFLYNLTTSEEHQSKVVSQGIVLTLGRLWPFVQDNVKYCRLVILAMCHLACGNVNTDKMIRQGATQLITWIVDSKRLPKYDVFRADGDLRLRVSASLRNLLTVVANQKPMVDQGCLMTLITLASESSEIIRDTSLQVVHPTNVMKTTRLDAARGDSARSYKRSSVNISLEKEVRKNCACGLRLITYNLGLRDVLLQYGGIDVILQEKDEVAIKHSLRKELETESWYNGSRGAAKEGRVRNIRPCGLFLELLQTQNNCSFANNIETSSVALVKYSVDVDVEEPRIDLDAQNIKLSISLTELATFSGDEEDAYIPTVQPCPKLDCEVETDPHKTLASIKHEGGSTLAHSHTTTIFEASVADVLKETVQRLPFSKDAGSFLPPPAPNSAGSTGDVNKALLSLEANFPTVAQHQAKKFGPESLSTYSSDTDSAFGLPSVFGKSSDKRGGGSGSKSQLVHLPKGKEERAMRSLVRDIKAASKGDGPTVDEIIEKYKNISKP